MPEQIQLPKGMDMYKVIQLVVGNTPYLICRQDRDKHPLMLERALQEFGITYLRKKIGNTIEIPEIEGHGYKMVGAGMALNRGDRKVSFGSKSTTYGIGINQDHLSLCQLLVPDKELMLDRVIFPDS